METKSDVYGKGPLRPTSPASMVIYIAFRGDRPTTGPLRLVIDDVDVVTFGRGDDRIERDEHSGQRRLVVRVLDPLMSTDHGRLLRVHDTWVLQDPDSKNGALVGAQRTRAAQIEPGQAFALGQTIFVLDRIEDRATTDLSSDALAPPLPELATFDEPLAARFRNLARVATTDVPIFIRGETGTGKEVVANAVHKLSKRGGAFVAVNCGGLAPTLIEAELFGHRRGAFSGATTDRLGYIRSADRGTLFLDEVADLPMTAQTALLRVLQEYEVVPVGDAKPVPVDLRICAATHRDVAQMVERGDFREDLYARLLGFQIDLPPLRNRRADLALLIRALLDRAGATAVRFAPVAAMTLYDYRWPRNIRELDRALAIACALAEDGQIGLEQLPPELIKMSGDSSTSVATAPVAEPPEPLTAQELELKARIEALMRAHDHNLAEVARQLGKDRTQVYRWVRRFRISRE